MAPEADLKDTDRCVMCGLCLPHCPTYGLSRDEGDSPRGRIALMQGLDSGALPVGERLLGHLDRCLECRACEAMCPSEVPFGRLMDAARARVEPHRPRRPGSRRLRRWGFGLLRRPRRLRTLARVLRYYQRSGLQWLVRHSGLLRLLRLAPLEARLPRLQRPLAAGHHSAVGPMRGRVALFTGCVESVAGADTQRDALRLLTRLGYEVVIPKNQGCCGALAQHNGDPATAAELARANLAAFDATGLEAIVSTASGCGVQLAAYGALYEADYPRAADFADKVLDISSFLAARDWPQGLLQARPETIAVHDPCTLRHGLKQHRAVYPLLARVPGLKTVTLNTTGACCGAAGSHVLTQPAQAEALRRPHIEQLRALGVRTLVSSNIGCALHLAAGIREAGLEIEVLHPVTLLARQLREGV
ncbi:MAG: (Fe-S)-binding protein [Gammaproteobacteria bacterium]|nr:(Fe-S)-binding protein [Gammaproteobacteria bacterium]